MSANAGKKLVFLCIADTAACVSRSVLWKAWEDADADGSGSLDPKEIETLLLRIGFAPDEIDMDATMSQVLSVMLVLQDSLLPRCFADEMHCC